MEAANATVENKLFDSVSTTQLAKPAGFDTDTSNHYVSRLNANTSVNKRVGPAIVLKVMAGDMLTASTYAWYNTPVQSPGSQPSLLNSLSTLFADGVLGATGKYVAAQQSAISSAAGPGITSLLTTKDGTYNSSSPKAFLNWVLLDNQFKYVTGGVSQVPVINSGTQKQVLTANLPATISKNGYLYIYVSNESPQDVYFDNITIKHYTGPLQQEQSYYPFNLPMAEICDKALLKQNTPYKGNNGVELEDEYGLQYYNTLFRKYDPQIGRFNGVDILAEIVPNINPYQFGGNNPLSWVDPTGASMADPNYYNGTVTPLNDVVVKTSTNTGGGYSWDEWQLLLDQNAGMGVNGSSGGMDASDGFIPIFAKFGGGGKSGGGKSNGGGGGYQYVLPVYESIMPTIYHHIEFAINDLNYPDVLTKDFPELTQGKRNQALRFWPKRPFGWQVDEYPFACTIQGGFGASTTLVPAWENSIQGEQLSALTAVMPIYGRFKIELLSKKEHPSPIGVPYYIVQPDGTRKPADKLFPKRNLQLLDQLLQPKPQPKPIPMPLVTTSGILEVILEALLAL